MRTFWCLCFLLTFYIWWVDSQKLALTEVYLRQYSSLCVPYRYAPKYRAPNLDTICSERVLKDRNLFDYYRIINFPAERTRD